MSLLDEDGIFLQVELEPEQESPDHVAHTENGLETEEDGGALGAESEYGDELEQLRATLDGERAEQETRLRDQETRLRDRLRDQQMELERVQRESEAEVTRLRAEADDLRDQLEEQKSKVKNVWRVNCEQISMYCCNKDDEICVLRARVVELEAPGATVHSVSVRVHDTLSARTTREETSPSSSIVRPILHPRGELERPTPKVVGRRGKAPPVDSFSSENPEDRFEDWLPTLERAAQWNGW